MDRRTGLEDGEAFFHEREILTLMFSRNDVPFGSYGSILCYHGEKRSFRIQYAGICEHECRMSSSVSGWEHCHLSSAYGCNVLVITKGKRNLGQCAEITSREDRVCSIVVP